jgi:hypothetical protein
VARDERDRLPGCGDVVDPILARRGCERGVLADHARLVEAAEALEQRARVDDVARLRPGGRWLDVLLVVDGRVQQAVLVRVRMRRTLDDGAGVRVGACTALASHSRGGRQSSSVKTTIGARAARQAALRLAHGGLEPGGRRIWRSVACSASGCACRSPSVSGPVESCATTTSKRSRSSVCSDSVSSSHRNRSGRSCDATTTAISGEIGAEP